MFNHFKNKLNSILNGRTVRSSINYEDQLAFKRLKNEHNLIVKERMDGKDSKREIKFY